jgi:phosphoribosyl-dephospho-CoA transferase
MIDRELKRHDHVYISKEGLDLLLQTAGMYLTDEDMRPIAEDFLRRAILGDVRIPGIVRRDESLPEGMIAVGFVSPQRHEGRHMRIAGLTRPVLIIKTERPGEVIKRVSDKPQTVYMQAIAEVKKYAADSSISIGVLGSAALEIVTGLPYTNEQSDIDLLLCGCTEREIYRAYREIMERIRLLGLSMDVVDMEVELANGYGIKAKELFMDTRTVLGKSLTDVRLLERNLLSTMFCDSKST